MNAGNILMGTELGARGRRLKHRLFKDQATNSPYLTAVETEAQKGCGLPPKASVV